MHVVWERALDANRRQRFLDEMNSAFAAFKADPAAWREELAEWDAVLADGQDPE